MHFNFLFVITKVVTIYCAVLLMCYCACIAFAFFFFFLTTMP